MKQYENDLYNWQIANNPEEIVDKLRVTKKGKEVPSGFSPSEYDEYLEKRNKIYSTFFSSKVGPEPKKGTLEWYQWNSNKNKLKTIFECPNVWDISRKKLRS